MRESRALSACSEDSSSGVAHAKAARAVRQRKNAFILRWRVIVENECEICSVEV